MSRICVSEFYGGFFDAFAGAEQRKGVYLAQVIQPAVRALPGLPEKETFQLAPGYTAPFGQFVGPVLCGSGPFCPVRDSCQTAFH
jgi:hypothetical protein